MYKIQKTDIFEKWFRKLRDIRAKALILTRIKRIELGNIGDHKSVGKKVYEMRIAYGPGYRVYFMQTGEITVLLISGGDKSSQKKDIRKAQLIVAGIGGKNE